MSPIIMILCILIGSGNGDSHGPCETKYCPKDSECQVRYTPCLVPPCTPPVGQCVLKDKPGSCPSDINKPGPCSDTCDTDAECPHDWKCCGRCQRKCTPPVFERVKPGQCPPISQCPDSLPYCPTSHQCRTDGDCLGSRKCCGRCPRLCIEPERHN